MISPKDIERSERLKDLDEAKREWDQAYEDTLDAIQQALVMLKVLKEENNAHMRKLSERFR